MELPQSLHVEHVDSQEGFKKLKPHWNHLLNSLSDYSPFLTWEWMFNWWHVYHTKDTRLLIIVVKDNDRIVSIMPLYIRSKGILSPRTIYFLGTGEPEEQEVCSEYLDIISLPAYTEKVSEIIANYLDSRGELWDCINFPRILDSSNILSCFVPGLSNRNYAVCKRFAGYRYYIPLPVSWSEYLSSLSGSARRSIRSAEKKSHEIYDLKFTFVSSTDELEDAMQSLIQLHSKYWNQKGKPGAFVSKEFCVFHHKIANDFLKSNSLQLLLLKSGQEIIGVLYNFKVMGSNYYYQSGLDIENYSNLKPGILLHSEAIKYSIKHKMKKYDFMMGASDSYKRHYSTSNSEMFHISIWNKGLYVMLMRKLALFPYFNNRKL